MRTHIEIAEKWSELEAIKEKTEKDTISKEALEWVLSRHGWYT